MGKLTHTVKGSIASFRSADKAPIESLKLHFLPKQEGSGDASPQNIRNILGWTGCNLYKAKRNLFSVSSVIRKDGYLLNDNGEESTTSFSGYTLSKTPVSPQTQYTISGNISMSLYLWRLYFYDRFGNFISRTDTIDGANGNDVYTFTTPSDCYGIAIQYTKEVVDFSTIKIEPGSNASEYESYEGSIMPLSWSDHGVEYGGYIDPVRGKLVAECEMLTDTWGNWGEAADQGDGTTLRYKKFTNPVYGNSINNHHMDYCNVTKYVYANGNGSPHYYIVGNSYNCRVYLPNDFSTDQVIQVIGKLITPIEYDIDPISLQTFLDYNNFWSDMNDDTEVEYCFADRLSIRKYLMVPETKLADWNQLIKDGNFTGNSIDGARWRASHDNKGTLSISDNVATWECVEVPAYYYQAGITWTYGSNYNYLQIPYNHKLYVRVDMRCSKAVSGRIYALVANGMHKYNIAIPIEANTWTTIRGMLPERVSVQTGEDDGIVKRFRTCIAGLNNMSDITVGTTYDVKNFMAFDLTQMFGLGNEPSTVEEFERICRINGIDLDTYQPYDLGSNRLMIMPM